MVNGRLKEKGGEKKRNKMFATGPLDLVGRKKHRPFLNQKFFHRQMSACGEKKIKAKVPTSNIQVLSNRQRFDEF